MSHYSHRSKKPVPILLYEGNFPEWQLEQAANFTTKGRPDQVYPAISHIENGKPVYHTSTFSDIESVLARISPTTRARIPLDDLEAKAGVLYAYLERLCKPFRLFKLPGELRDKIYKEVVHVPGRYLAVGNNTHDAIPNLAQTTQQLRREVFPIFYSINTFGFLASNAQGDRVRGDISRWNDRVLGPAAKLLRQFDLQVSGGSRYGKGAGCAILLHIKFDKVRGLSIEFPTELNMESKAFLVGMAALVEAERQKENVEGEAILTLLDRLCSVTSRNRRPLYGDWLKLE